ncbi:hypothetical protein MTQ13_00375 [Streptomyces sp. XM4011]|uniref:hypothetical protein n=1 Tax=Streptomyces sp. XM4011 TaxID=2929780 RepID=UPI001FF8CE3E|nr:hypothetical protein [Streptomyces sp. XM4011]MCK1812746.1 hypothetical protein [Streptomyces sp. XM4011]
MPTHRPHPRRGTTVLGGDERHPTPGGRPWWLGAAVAGGGFLLLLGVAIAVNTGLFADPAPALVDASADAKRAEADQAGKTVLRGAGGVPLGYPRTEAGAVRAATNYQLARSSVEYITDRSYRHQLLAEIAESESEKSLIRTDDSAMDLVLASLGIRKRDAATLVARAAPLGVTVSDYSRHSATVEVWAAGLIGTTSDSAPLPVSASWNTHTVTLRWQEDDWKLAGVASRPGPTPLDTGSTPSTLDDFRRADEQFDAPPYLG